MPEWDDLPFPMPHPGQAIILNHPARFRVVACGRRFGKSLLAKLDALLTAIDGGVAWWVLPTYTMAQESWSDLEFYVEGLADIKIERGNRRIRFPSGGMLAVRSGHEPDRLRGAGLDAVIIDEAAFCSPAVWHAVRPALSDRGGKALLLSTPQGRNWFWGLYQKGLDPDQAGWVSWQMPTWANPFIPREEIEAARHDMPAQTFAQEYQAAFLSGANAVFPEARACVGQPRYQAGQQVVFGVDWGRMDDYTAVIVMSEAGHVVDTLRIRGLRWATQREKLIRLAKRWSPEMILAEANSIGGPNIEALREAGLPVRGFTTTAQSKPPLIDALALALEERYLTLPDDPALLAELDAYTITRGGEGGYHYSAPSGLHDDLVIALALAWRAVRIPRATVKYDVWG